MKNLVFVMLILVVAGGAWLLLRNPSGTTSTPSPEAKREAAVSGKTADPNTSKATETGNTTQQARGTTPARTPADPTNDKNSAESQAQDRDAAIRPQPLSPKDNPNVQSVIEAARTGKYPERLTSSIKPKPFDKAAFEANPKAYLDVVEPGRIWDTAKAGPDVKSIEVHGQNEFDIHPDGHVTLEAMAEPLAPVTFTSFDFGAFDNQLTSITVRADEDGLAKVNFKPIAGTVANVEIMAASPLNAGQVKFHVRISKK